MPSVTLVDTTSAQTLTGPKTLTGGVITGGTVSLAAAPVNALDAATKGYVDGLNTTPLLNVSLAASVASNILTLSLRTAAGATPSSTDPARVVFRNSTDADGSLVTRTVTGTTTLTFASGSTLGTVNGVQSRLWVGLLDNAGTVELCAWNPLKSVTGPPAELSLKGFTPNTDVTTTAEGSGTATSAHTLYSTNARSSVPFVLLGFIEITEATAGVWATAPVTVQTYRDGMKKTGDLVQVCYTATGAVATGTTTIPNDDTVPQNTEGDQYLSQAITPTHATNILQIHAHLNLADTAAGGTALALFQDSTASALAVSFSGYPPTAVWGNASRLEHTMLAGTVASTTLKIRAGATTSTTFNGSGAARKYSGALVSFIRVQEIFL